MNGLRINITNDENELPNDVMSVQGPKYGKCIYSVMRL